MGLFSSIASVFGASKKKKAVKQAAAAQAAAAQAGIDQQNAQFAQTQQNIEPYLGAGTKALGAQQDLLGLNGTGVQQNQLDALRASPLFQQLFGAGQDAVLSNASATGGLRGGNAQRSLYDAGENTFAQVIQQQLANLGGLSGQGLGAATGLGQLGAENAGQISQLLGNKGAAQAGGILGSAAANQQLLAALGGLGDYGAELLLGGGGGGGSGGGINMSAVAKAFM